MTIDAMIETTLSNWIINIITHSLGRLYLKNNSLNSETHLKFNWSPSRDHWPLQPTGKKKVVFPKRNKCLFHFRGQLVGDLARPIALNWTIYIFCKLVFLGQTTHVSPFATSIDLLQKDRKRIKSKTPKKRRRWFEKY